MISFLETIKGNDPVFFIHALCGIGDITSHLARLPSVEKVYPNHKIVFLLGLEYSARLTVHLANIMPAIYRGGGGS